MCIHVFVGTSIEQESRNCSLPGGKAAARCDLSARRFVTVIKFLLCSSWLSGDCAKRDSKRHSVKTQRLEAVVFLVFSFVRQIFRAEKSSVAILCGAGYSASSLLSVNVVEFPGCQSSVTADKADTFAAGVTSGLGSVRQTRLVVNTLTIFSRLYLARLLRPTALDVPRTCLSPRLGLLWWICVSGRHYLNASG